MHGLPPPPSGFIYSGKLQKTLDRAPHQLTAAPQSTSPHHVIHLSVTVTNGLLRMNTVDTVQCRYSKYITDFSCTDTFPVSSTIGFYPLTLLNCTEYVFYHNELCLKLSYIL